MRTLMLSAATLALCTALAGTARADCDDGYGNVGYGYGRGLLPRLMNDIGTIEALNDRRPADEFSHQIYHQINMIRDRLNEMYARRGPFAEKLALIDESLGDILDYNNNGRYEVPYIATQIDVAVGRMRHLIAESQGAYVPDGGYQAPAPAPAYYQPPVVSPPVTYVPPPAPVRYRPYRPYWR